MACSISSAGMPRPTGGSVCADTRTELHLDALRRRAPARRLGATPLSVTLTDCFTGSPALQRVGPGQRQRAHVGLERGIGPVAVILHLEGVALHAHGRFQPGHHLVRERADRRNGWIGSTSARELRLHDLAVDVLDLDRAPGHALERMQHDEAGARGQEVGLRHGGAGELEVAVGLAFDAGVVGDLLARPRCTPRGSDTEKPSARCSIFRLADASACRCPSSRRAPESRARAAPRRRRP